VDAEPLSPMQNLALLLSRPDNVAILILVLLVLAATFLAIRQALAHDRLIKEGRSQDVLKRMQD
jgi:uncharacterized membrane protein YwzB